MHMFNTMIEVQFYSKCSPDHRHQRVFAPRAHWNRPRVLFLRHRRYPVHRYVVP